VFHHLIDAAEEEETKETILAYYHLLIAGKFLSITELDKKIEDWFENKYSCRIDFDMQDAIDKLVRLGLVVQNDNAFKAISLLEANEKLDILWDGYFEFEGLK